MKSIKLNYTYAMGPAGHGTLISEDEINAVKNDICQAYKKILSEKHEKKELSFLALPYAYGPQFGETSFGDVLWKAHSEIKDQANMIRQNRSDFIQIAIGGSALGAIALNKALSQTHTPRIHLPDNIDPEMIAEIISSVDLRNTQLNVISKSGGTVETLANFYIFYHEMRKYLSREELKQHIIIMTNPEKGTLAELCRKEGFTLIPIPESVHGRFSIFSPGGFLTSAVSGIDIDEILRGARDMDDLTDRLDFWENPLMLIVALHYIANTRKKIDNLILMPYTQKLMKVADWYSQLVAESLGKDNKGITPVKALGATDQHSQLQLYNDGPKNKMVMFFEIESFRSQLTIPKEFEEFTDYSYLWNQSLNDLFNSEKNATSISLYNHGVPNFSLQIPEITPYYVGQLFMLLEKVIPVLGELYSVNAFTQDGVEESKEFARAILGKNGEKYDIKRKEISDFENINSTKTTY